MDGMTLLEEAREAGLTVRVDGGKLVIRGPQSAELLVGMLIQNKSMVMEILTQEELLPRPADRPGYLCELARRNGSWVWRFRRPDAADAAWAAWSAVWAQHDERVVQAATEGKP